MKNRSKYKDDWYPSIVDMLYRYPQIKSCSDKMHVLYAESIEKTLEEIKETHEDYELRLRAFDMVYFKRTHTHGGTALKLHISERTLVRWKYDFVHRIAKNVGWVE